MAFHRVDLIIEAKEDETIDGVPPGVPGTGASAEFTENLLADVTKHEAQLGWRVTRVRPVAAGTALVSAADLSHVLDRIAQGRWLNYEPYLGAVQALRRDLEASWAGEQP